MFSKPHPYFVLRPDPLAGHGFDRAVANGGDKLSGTRNISGFGNTCRRPAELRAEFKTHFSNDRQCSDRPRIQFMQVVSCYVLHHASPGLRNPAGHLHDLHSNDPIPNRPDGAEWPLRIRSCNSPHCCIGTIPRIQRQELIVLDQRLLELPKCDPCLYMDRQIRRIVFRNSAEAR